MQDRGQSFREVAMDVIYRGSRLLYPGYIIRKRIDEINLGYREPRCLTQQ